MTIAYVAGIYPVNMSEPLLHSAINTLVSTCYEENQISALDREVGIAWWRRKMTHAVMRRKTYPEILNNRIHFDVRFIIAEGIL